MSKQEEEELRGALPGSVIEQPRRGSRSVSVSRSQRARAPSDVSSSLASFANMSQKKFAETLDELKSRSAKKYGDATLKEQFTPNFYYKGMSEPGLGIVDKALDAWDRFVGNPKYEEKRAGESNYTPEMLEKMKYHIDNYGTGQFVDIIGAGPSSRPFQVLMEARGRMPEALPPALVDDLDSLPPAPPYSTHFYRRGGSVKSKKFIM